MGDKHGEGGGMLQSSRDETQRIVCYFSIIIIVIFAACMTVYTQLYIHSCNSVYTGS